MEAAMKQSYFRKLILALVLVTPLAAACGKTVGETIDDTTITTRVKTAMLNDPSVGGLRIDVDTFKGVVTLSGRVKSEAEKQQAVTLARRVSGVTEVKDSLQVLPEAGPATPPPAQNQ
jgi:hyperosmotically inducible protein